METNSNISIFKVTMIIAQKEYEFIEYLSDINALMDSIIKAIPPNIIGIVRNSLIKLVN